MNIQESEILARIEAPIVLTETERRRINSPLLSLEEVGLELANNGHTWSPRERAAFERRVRELKR